MKAWVAVAALGCGLGALLSGCGAARGVRSEETYERARSGAVLYSTVGEAVAIASDGRLVWALVGHDAKLGVQLLNPRNARQLLRLYGTYRWSSTAQIAATRGTAWILTQSEARPAWLEYQRQLPAARFRDPCCLRAGSMKLPFPL